MKQDITLNWHVTEHCNYSCHYCFAHYSQGFKNPQQELHHNLENVEILLKKLYLALKELYPKHSLRLNFAGGEPLCVPHLESIFQIALACGFKISIITNASLLTTEKIASLAPLMCLFGMSIDSASPSTHQKIGRCSHHHAHNHNTERFKEFVRALRVANPEIKIKINTVVNEFNYQEDMSDFILSLQPDKWKIFQALSIDTDRIFCTQKQFERFLKTHERLRSIIVSENRDEMTDSYIMLDSYARFYHNTNGKYHYSPPLLPLSIQEIIRCLHVDMDKYYHRYRGQQSDQGYKMQNFS